MGWHMRMNLKPWLVSSARNALLLTLTALLLGVAPCVVSAQAPIAPNPLSAPLPKACWPSTLLKGKDTVYFYVPCRSLDVLEPTFRAGLECMTARQRKGGWKPLVQETLRSDALQRRYYAKGRTTAGPRITNASTVSTTVHGYGLAADVISATKGWKDMRFFHWQAQHAEACGLTAGHFWKKLKDSPHVQTGKWAGSPPQWARTLLARDSLPAVWRRLLQ